MYSVRGLQCALDKIDELEQTYLELFLGKRVETTSTHRVRVVLSEDKTNYVVARFSETAGVLPLRRSVGRDDTVADRTLADAVSAEQSQRTPYIPLCQPGAVLVVAGAAEPVQRRAAAVRVWPDDRRRGTGKIIRTADRTMSHTERMIALLGAMRREMNGEVSETMTDRGVSYGLNYGVSIPSVREIARRETADHAFAKYLYGQQVRELRLAACHLADPAMVTVDEFSFWSRGLTTGELAAELAFALLSRIEGYRCSGGHLVEREHRDDGLLCAYGRSPQPEGRLRRCASRSGVRREELSVVGGGGRCCRVGHGISSGARCRDQGDVVRDRITPAAVPCIGAYRRRDSLAHGIYVISEITTNKGLNRDSAPFIMSAVAAAVRINRPSWPPPAGVWRSRCVRWALRRSRARRSRRRGTVRM